MASSAEVGGWRLFSAMARQQMSNTVSSQGYGPLWRQSSLQMSISCSDTFLRHSLAPKSWGRVYIITGRPPGETAFLHGRILWVFQRWTNSCSSLYKSEKNNSNNCTRYDHLTRLSIDIIIWNNNLQYAIKNIKTQGTFYWNVYFSYKVILRYS